MRLLCISSGRKEGQQHNFFIFYILKANLEIISYIIMEMYIQGIKSGKIKSLSDAIFTNDCTMFVKKFGNTKGYTFMQGEVF